MDPPYEATGAAAALDEAAKFDMSNPVPARSSDIDPIQWVDIGFWIRPDGRTSEPEILRGSRSTGWATYLLKQVSKRRYTGLSSIDGDRGVYRIERFTLRGTYMVPLGGLARRRGGSARLEVLELTQPDTYVRRTVRARGGTRWRLMQRIQVICQMKDRTKSSTSLG